MRLYANINLLVVILVVLFSLARAQDDDNTSAAATTDTSATANTDSQTDAATTSAESAATRTATTASATQASDDTETSEETGTSASASASASASDSDRSVTRLPSSASATATDYDGITNAPTVTGGIPTYPAASVPPTKDAPFMHKSSLPQGTVFICVGAVLAFALAVVLVWRGSVAYLLRRGMKRASANGYMHPTQDYSQAGGKTPAFYSQGVGSTLSLDPLTGGGKGGTKGGSVPDSVRQSLFFSPTAGAGAHSGSNRNSGYLPAGYYAAGASVAGGGVAGNGRPISMADFTTNTRPQSSGYQAARSNESPRDSPALRPTDSPYGRLAPAGMSTASLGQKSDGRAPSAYLDDLFDYPPVSQHGHDR